MAAYKSARDLRHAQDNRRGASAKVDGGKAKKRTPLRKITAKKVKPPREVAVGPKQIRHLRGLGHALDPVVHVGKAGVTAELVASACAQLAAHELIKVKLSEEDRDVRAELAVTLAAKTGAVLAQVLGRTVLLYKRHPKNPKIVLPAGAAHVDVHAAPASATQGETEDEESDDEDVSDEPDEDESDEEESGDEDESDEDESDDEF